MTPDHTGSGGTRILGALALAAVAAVAVFGLVISPADKVQEDAVRIMYVHVPIAILGLGTSVLVSFASLMWLRRRSAGWDALAAAAAELGLVFSALTLLTGAIWGRPTWGVYWTWDARLTSTALLLVLLLGYQSLRRSPGAVEVRNRRAALLGLLLTPNVIVVHYSVDWWRSLHQGPTITRLDPQIDGLLLFSLVLGLVAGALVFAWLLVHRFRVAWLEAEAERRWLDDAVAERKAEAQA